MMIWARFDYKMNECKDLRLRDLKMKRENAKVRWSERCFVVYMSRLDSRIQTLKKTLKIIKSKGY